MKLAIVSAYPPSKVTLNEYAYHLVKNFSTKKEIREIVILTDVKPCKSLLEFKESTCVITAVQCWSFNSYSNLFSIFKTIQTIQPDIVFFNLQFMKFGDNKIAAGLGLLLPLVCKFKNIPSLVLLHNILEQVDLKAAGFTRNKLWKTIFNFIGTYLTRAILTSDIVAVTLGKYVEVLEEKYRTNNVALIPHGTFEIEDEIDIHQEEKVFRLLTFGKFGTYKKVEVLIEALIAIRERVTIKIELVIAGTDNPNVPGYLAGVQKKYAHVQGLFFPGYIEEENIATLFKESSVVVLPYTGTTGSSGVLHQAAGYGKVIVLPDLGDFSLLMKEEGYIGAYFEPENCSSLADTLENLINDKHYRDTIAHSNFNASKALSMADVTNWYILHFQNILQKYKVS